MDKYKSLIDRLSACLKRLGDISGGETLTPHDQRALRKMADVGKGHLVFLKNAQKTKQSPDTPEMKHFMGLIGDYCPIIETFEV